MAKENNVEDRAYKIYSALKVKKPFTYKIGNKIYYIGCAICRECTDEEKGIYRANKIIVTNPRNITDELVLDLYKKVLCARKFGRRVKYFTILPLQGG